MLQIGARLWQLPGQLQARTIKHAAALLDFPKQAISIGIEHHPHLGIGLTKRRGEQTLGKYQGVIGLTEQYRATENALVFRGISRCRMLKAHFGRRNIQAGDPVAKGYPAGQGFFTELSLVQR